MTFLCCPYHQIGPALSIFIRYDTILISGGFISSRHIHPYPMPTESEMWSKRDSWPPTQVRLTSSAGSKDEPRPLLDDIDEDPFTYFLTPIPDGDDDTLHMEEMSFDAGIEDASHPRDIIRSVSPSSLSGLRSPQIRASSPDYDSSATMSDDDDEDYIRFAPGRPGLFNMRSLSADNLRQNSRSPNFGYSASQLLSPASFPGSPPYRGRSQYRARGLALTRSLSASARTRPGHLWREPSPDVWSIEEETEEEIMSEVGGSSNMAGLSGAGGEGAKLSGSSQGVTAKPKKKVRFVLPGEVIGNC